MKRTILALGAVGYIFITNFAVAAAPPANLAAAIGPVAVQNYRDISVWCQKRVSSDTTLPTRNCGPFGFETTEPFQLRNLSLMLTKASDASTPERHDTLCTAYVYIAPGGDFSFATMLGQFSWNGDDHSAIQYAFPVPLTLSPGSYALQVSMQAFGQPDSGTSAPSECSLYGRLFYTVE